MFKLEFVIIFYDSLSSADLFIELADKAIAQQSSILLGRCVKQTFISLHSYTGMFIIRFMFLVIFWNF